MCNKTFSERMQHTWLFISDSETVTDQNVNTIKIQLGESMRFTGFHRGMWVRGYLQEEKDSQIAASTRPSPAWVITHKAEDLAHTAQAAGSSTDWSLFFRGLSCSKLLLAAWLVSASSRLASESALLIWEFFTAQHPPLRGLSVFIAYSNRGRPSESCQF